MKPITPTLTPNQLVRTPGPFQTPNVPVADNAQNAVMDPHIVVNWKVWRPFSGFNELNKLLVDGHKELKQISDTLQGVIHYIDAVKDLVKIIATFEDALESILYAFVQAILDQLQTMLNDVESTGIYALDLTSYHWIKKDADSLTGSLRGAWYDTVVENAVGNNGVVKATGLNVIDFLTHFGVQYKSESYNEFMTKTANAFLDENDLPLSISGAYGQAQAAADAGQYTTDKNRQTNGVGGFIANTEAAIMQSGRPNFGPHAQMNVILIVLCFKDLEAFLKAYSALSSILDEKLTKGANIYNDIKFAIISAKSQLDAAEPITAEALTNAGATASDIEYYEKVMQQAGQNLQSSNSSFADTFTQIIKANKPTINPRSAIEPNFIGINAYTIGGPIFDYIQTAINWLRKKTYHVNIGLAANILAMLDALESEVNDILTIVKILDDVITAIEAILSITGIRILNFQTDKGIAGVVEILKNAANFNDDAKTQGIDKRAAQAGQVIKTISVQIDNDTARLSYLNQDLLKYKAQTIAANNKIISAPVDNSFFINKSLTAPTAYNPDTTQTIYSTYPSNVQSLYVTYNTANNKLNTCLTDIANTKNDLNIQNAALNAAQQVLADADPEAAEANRRNIAAMNILQLQNAADYQQGLLNISTIELTNLRSIQATMTNYCNELTINKYDKAVNDLYVLTNTYKANLANYTNALNNAINLGNNTTTYTNAFNTYNSINDPITKLDTDYNVALNTLNTKLAATLAYDTAGITLLNNQITALTGTYTINRTAALQLKADVTWVYNNRSVYNVAQVQTVLGKLASTTDALSISKKLLLLESYGLSLMRANMAKQKLLLSIAAYGINPLDINYIHNSSNQTIDWVVIYPDTALWMALNGTQKVQVAALFHGTTSAYDIADANSIADGLGNTTLGYVIVASLNNIINDSIAAEELALNGLYMEQRQYKKLLDMLTNDIGISVAQTVLNNNDRQYMDVVNGSIVVAENVIKSMLDTAYNKNLAAVTNVHYRGVAGLDMNTDWSGNEIGYMVSKYAYDRYYPQVLVGDIGALRVSNVCGIVESAIAAVVVEQGRRQKTAKAAHDAVVAAQSREDKKKSVYTDTLTFSKPWDPNAKMYYGGFLFCAGWPNYTDKNYFNVSNIYKQNFRNPVGKTVKDTSPDFKKQWDIIKKVL